MTVAGLFLLCLLLAMALCLLAYSVSASLGPASTERQLDSRSQREATLESKLQALLAPVLAAADMRIVVSHSPLPPAPNAPAATPDSLAAPAAVAGQVELPLRVVVLVNREVLTESLRELMVQLLRPALGLPSVEQGAIDIIAAPFLPPATPRQLLPSPALLQVMLTASLAFAAAASLLLHGWRRRSAGQVPAVEEDYRPQVQQLRALSREEPRRVAGVLSQWMQQDEH